VEYNIIVVVVIVQGLYVRNFRQLVKSSFIPWKNNDRCNCRRLYTLPALCI